MPDYKNFFESGGLKIEVEDGSGGTANAYVGDFLGSIQSIAAAIVTQVNQFPQDQRPDEIQVTFGLKALSTGGFAISYEADSANFKISLRWGAAEGGSFIDGLAFSGQDESPF